MYDEFAERVREEAKRKSKLRMEQHRGEMSVGDLISREELLKSIDGIWDCNDMVFTPDDHCCNIPEDCKGCKWAETKDAIRRIIENFPAVKPKTKR